MRFVPAAFAASATTLTPCTYNCARCFRTPLVILPDLHSTMQASHPFVHFAGAEVVVALERQYYVLDARQALGHRLRIGRIALHACRTSLSAGQLGLELSSYMMCEGAS